MTYTYDYLNRLIEADIDRGLEFASLSDYGDITYNYDNNGNILDIDRSFTNTDYNDHLIINYEDGRNRLSTVNEKLQSYDYNGNLIHDRLPSLSDANFANNVFYNYQNLPDRVEMSRDSDSTAVGVIEYAYTPDGQRNRKFWKLPDGTVQGDELYFLDIDGKKAGKFTIDATSGWLKTNYLNLYSGGELVGRYNPEAASDDLVDSIVVYVTDHLGSIRIALSDTLPTNFDIMSTEPSKIAYTSNYMPFGGYLPVTTDNSQIQDEEFTGKPLDEEFDLGWHYFGARFYRSRLGVWNQVDPLTQGYPSLSPYNYAENTPLVKIDPDGRSTTIAGDGTVQSVDEDGSFVVQQNLPVGFEGPPTPIGETEHWDEFRAHDSETGEVKDGVAAGATIRVGESWNSDIEVLNSEANSMSLPNVALKSLPGGKFDIKSKSEYAPNGTATGKLLNGKYATAQSAGNYLAGLNASTGTIFGQHLSYDTFMRMAGVVHAGVNSKGAPYFGEIPYAGRMTFAGYNASLLKR